MRNTWVRALGIITIFLAFATCPLAEAGGGSTGGGDVMDIADQSAWFLGANPIRYCIEVADRFGIARQDLERDTEAAFRTWQEYLSEKGINADPGRKKDGLFLEFNHQLLSRCDGSEDLKIYFGVTTSEVVEAKKHFNNPVAFAHRTAYDKEKGWGKGFLWFAMPDSVTVGMTLPDWKKPFALSGMLLHEMGHVLGCPHVEGTIMSQYLANSLSFDGLYKYLFRSIDHRHELVLCESHCTHTYPGLIGHMDLTKPSPSDIPASEVFRKFVGRLPVGAVRAQVTVQDGIRFSMRLSDDSATEDFPIAVSDDWAVFGDYINVFSMVLEFVQPGSATQGYASFPLEGKMGFGTVHAKDGREYSVNLERNSNTGVATELRIRYWDGGKRKTLFEALWPGDA